MLYKYIPMLKKIINTYDIKPSISAGRELERLLFELKILNIHPEQIITYIKKHFEQSGCSGKEKIANIKSSLIKLRFPASSLHRKILPQDVYLPQINNKREKVYHPGDIFSPEKIFIENNVKNCEIERNLKKLFPDTPAEYIVSCSQKAGELKPDHRTLKVPYIFVVKEKHDFLKPCPCTRGHLGCGYWILNLGFGCPFDCSYCYLQQYQNVPGLIIPANIDDFFDSFDKFHQKINRTIRIGTGEFCDSLALDHITEYSKKLVPFFSKKDVLFELKTKSRNIDNLLSIPASKNTIISWSLNPQIFIDNEEIAVAPLKQRLEAAQKVQQHGYSIAFHFDPIVLINNWEKEYTRVVELIYQHVKPGLAWISLGTLRFTRTMKTAMEQRFPGSILPYQELLLGKDRKLRYIEELRQPAYNHLKDSIRKFDTKTPVYLCMESHKIWQNFDPSVKDTSDIEKTLI